MSHTVIVDEDYRARQFENRLNVVIRHCKIGKVTPAIYRPTTAPVAPKVNDIWKEWPFNDRSGVPSPQYLGECGCKVGTACGNAACPHALIAMCAS
ncbi:hypothetical protein [Rhizobium leguminosarum]